MNKRISFLRKASYMMLIAFTAFTLGSCRDEISTEARYTFTGHTVASYLEENEEYFSLFIEILKRGERFSLMKAYGTYTCFAPTNEAVERFVREQYHIYDSTTVSDKENIYTDIITGIYTPNVEDLLDGSERSDSMCKVIAQTHLIDKIYLTTDMTNDIIPRMNLNDRYLSSKYGLNEEGRPVLIINNTAEVIERDVEVENGVVHAISSVLSPSTNTVPTQLEQYKYFSIFTEALKETGLNESLQLYKDWKGNDIETDYEWDGELVEHFDEGVKTGRPLSRYYGYSLFVETDSTFALYGINTFADLIEKCKEWYPNATDKDFTNPNNALHQFVSYHIVPRKVTYENLTFTNKTLAGVDFEDHWVAYTDRHEYYETLDNHLIKVTTPRSLNNNDTRRIINFSKNGANLPSMEEHVNIQVCDPNDVKAIYPDFDQVALNGIIHVIDKVLIYNEDEMAGNILNCVMRFDIAAMIPELVTNDVRWTANGEAGAPGQGGNTRTYCICNETDNYLEHSKHFKQNSKESRLYYLCPEYSWINYQGDEFIATGKFDISYKLPPVPEGTYEIRIGYSQSSLRGIVQFYVDDFITGIPVDLIKTGADPIVGWKLDDETEDDGVTNDKEMKNRGYLAGPSSYKYETTTARKDVTSLRKVLVTKYLSSDTDHWLRLKNVTPMDNGYRQIMHDYVEIVPIGYVRSEEIPYSEKRK